VKRQEKGVRKFYQQTRQEQVFAVVALKMFVTVMGYALHLSGAVHHEPENPHSASINNATP